VAFVNKIANGLPDQVTRYGKAGKAVIRENFPSFLTVLFGNGSLIDVKMISPTRKLKAIIAHFGSFFSQSGKG
jgi:hypothetical protein